MPRRFDLPYEETQEEEVVVNEEVKKEDTGLFSGLLGGLFGGGSFIWILIIIGIFFLLSGKGFGYGYSIDE